MGYSPALGVMTAVFEIAGAFWIIMRQRSHGQRSILLPIVISLFLLAGYQIIEVGLCWKSDGSNLFLARLGFLDITWLPPVSLLLISRLVTPRSRPLILYARFSLFIGALLSLWIIMDYRFVTGTICEFMYARYSNVQPWFNFYGAFYEITQMSMIFVPAYLLSRIGDAKRRKDLSDLLIGSLLFIIPSLYVASVWPSIFENGLPSLMCHFAIFYAVFLLRIAHREMT